MSATATIQEIITAQTVAGPFRYGDIIKVPGVYRTKDTPKSTAVVVMAEAQSYLVEETFYTDLGLPPSDDCQFWRTIMEVPRAITEN